MKPRASRRYIVPESVQGEGRLRTTIMIPPESNFQSSYTPQYRSRHIPAPEDGKTRRDDIDGRPFLATERPSAAKRPKNRPLRNPMFAPIAAIKPPWRVPEEIQRIREAYGMSLETMSRMLGVTARRMHAIAALDAEGVPKAWIDADVAMRIERLTGASALDLLSMDAATQIWVFQMSDLHQQMLGILPVLPSIMGRRNKDGQ
jgi:plasmid maintenance system antidote protein VapI